jgi:hypothetical protein
MRRSPESLVNRLRNRKRRIVCYTILIIAGLLLLAAAGFVLVKSIGDLAFREGDDLQLHVVIGQQILVGIAFLDAMSLLLATGIGAAIAMLVGEVTSFTKDDLLVNLWDRVQALEQSEPIDSQPPIPNP